VTETATLTPGRALEILRPRKPTTHASEPHMDLLEAAGGKGWAAEGHTPATWLARASRVPARATQRAGSIPIWVI